MASVTRLKRLVMTVSALRDRAAAAPDAPGTERTLGYRERLDQAVSDDLNTPRALPVLDEMLADQTLSPAERLAALTDFDAVLGLDLAGSAEHPSELQYLMGILDAGFCL